MTEQYLTDDEQLEAVKHFLKENGSWILGGIAVGAALFFGFRYYEGRTNQQGQAASAVFNEVALAVESNDRAKARRLADTLIQGYPSSPYADQARLVQARLDVDDGKLEGAVAPLTTVMNGSKDSELRNVARLRLARVWIALGKPDEALKALADPIPNGFAAAFNESRGDAHAAKKDTAAAIADYQAALAAHDGSPANAMLLGLKLQDLGGAPAPVVKAVSVDPQAKVKP